MTETIKIIRHFSPVTDEAREAVAEYRTKYKSEGFKVSVIDRIHGVSVMAYKVLRKDDDD